MLVGTKILLREPQGDDVRAIAALRNDVELQATLLAVARSNPLRRVEDWIHAKTNDTSGVFFVIAERREDCCCGFVQLSNIDTLHRRAEMGICLVHDSQGKGFGEEAIRLLESYAVDAFNLKKLVLHVRADNAAIRLYERLGFQSVGTLREHHYHCGTFHDVRIMEHFLKPRGDTA